MPAADEALTHARRYFTQWEEKFEAVSQAAVPVDTVLEYTRRCLGYTHADLAELTGHPRSGYANLIRRLRDGQHVSVRVVESYLSAMDCRLLLVPIPIKRATIIQQGCDCPPKTKVATRRREREKQE